MRGAAGIIIYRRRGSAIEVGTGTSTSTEDKNKIKTPAARVLRPPLLFSLQPKEESSSNPKEELVQHCTVQGTSRPAFRSVMPFQKLLGPVLKDSARNDTPTSALEGKVVALYFSASW